MTTNAGYKLVRLRNGACCLHSLAYGETMHPGLGPVAEAEALYVRQLKLQERLDRHTGEFVIWDIGLGAGANALTVLRATRGFSCPVRVISFDNTAEPLAFALEHEESLGYFGGYEPATRALLERQSVEFNDGKHEIQWSFELGDFPTFLVHHRRSGETLPSKSQIVNRKSKIPSPHAILFDAFSPARNPAMWTLPLFTNLFHLLDPQRPCSLATYSRSTMLRVTLLLAGFFVGRGAATGMKEETTVAANTPALIDEPLDHTWLARARRSKCAEPLSGPNYRQAPLSSTAWESLRQHPQFL